MEGDLQRLIREALREDLGQGDLTTDAVVGRGVRGAAVILAREALVVAGLDPAREVFRSLDPEISFQPGAADGEEVAPDSRIAEVRGEAAAILKGERLALNLLQHLSGVATVTRSFVRKVSDLPVEILDTRKTLPGMRFLEKYAVRMGGGKNHRMGLYDAVLIKDNHIALAGGIAQAVQRVRERFPGLGPIEVEAADLEEVRQALEAEADIILLDNMGQEMLRAAVQMIRGRARVEASGNIRLDNVREVALTGVDRISVGALTHSVRAVDIALKM